MGKYTPLQLQGMARQFLAADNRSDMRCLQLLTTMMIKTGLPFSEIRNRIIDLAQSNVGPET